MENKLYVTLNFLGNEGFTNSYLILLLQKILKNDTINLLCTYDMINLFQLLPTHPKKSFKQYSYLNI